MDIKALQSGEGRSVWVVGDRYTFLETGAETGNAYTLIHALVPPQSGPPPHIHRREDEAFYVLEGELLVQVDGRTFRAKQGTWLTLPKGSLHTFKNIGSADAKMLMLVTPAGLERYFEEVGSADRESSVTAASIKKLMAAAPRYGMEVVVP
jgi:quercetin dioxygenase-like cupin family protein